eukprot:TCONS_00014513-protein
MIKLDLKDPYFSVALGKQYKRFVRFEWKGKLYQFLCMCFVRSWSSTQVIHQTNESSYNYFEKTKYSVLSGLSGRHFGYGEFSGGDSDGKRLLDISPSALSFIINIQKSHLEPCQELEFLGVTVNSVKMELTLPSDKIEKIISQCEQILSQTKVSVMDLTKLLGRLTSSAVAVLAAPLHYRKIQRCQIKALIRGSYQSEITLSEKVRLELEWWKENLKLSNGKSLLMKNPDLVMSTDASKKGW